jgi:hypothetical protein
MIQPRNKAPSGPFHSRRSRSWCAIVALATATLLGGTACDEEAAGRAFRDAAATSLESGVKSIMDGVIEGLFAAFDIGTDQASDDTTTPGGTSS